MPKKTTSFNSDLEGWLRARGFDKISTLDADGDPVPTAKDADQFRFNYKNGPYDYGQVGITTHDGKVTVYYNQSVVRDGTRSIDTQWTDFLKKLKDWSLRNGQMKFKIMNMDRLGLEMSKRKNQKREEQLLEGWYGNKHTSYNDGNKSIKLVIKHSKTLGEDDRRYHFIEKIFLETEQGERILVPSKKPSVGRAFAQHLAEGGEYNDDRWKHIRELAEDISKLGGFIRATRSGQFNEDAGLVVEQVQEHYQQLRKAVKQLGGSRGYNQYFEGWQPTLLEGDTESSYGDMFKRSTVDPRIEAALPVISKLNIQINKIAEADEFSDWANNIVEAINPVTDKKIEDFAKLLATDKLPVGPDAINIKNQLSDVLDDTPERDDLFDELDELALADPDNDSKSTIIGWLQKNKDEQFYGSVLDRMNTGSSAAPTTTNVAVEPAAPKKAEPAKKVEPTKANAQPNPADVKAAKEFMPTPLAEDSDAEPKINEILDALKKIDPKIFSKHGSEAVYQATQEVVDAGIGNTDDMVNAVQDKLVIKQHELDESATIARIKSLSGLK